uniref:Ig-like domain-containing protein n=1 Tax=Rhabditophanes sp. KR3021 TaxID=114890 RepID=A0AC35THD7_9BILA
MIKLSSHVNHFLFYILIQSIVAFSATPSPPQQLILKSGKIKHVADTGIAEPITIWCSVSHPATINSAYFVKTSTKKGNNKLVGVVELQNASYTFEKPTISDAGQWKCVLKTSTVEQTAIIDIYSRPVIETNDEIRLEEKDKVNEPFTLIAHGKNAKSNGEAKLSCTAHGYPKPAVKWTRRVHQIPLKHPEYVTIGNSITLKNLDNEKAG